MDGDRPATAVRSASARSFSAFNGLRRDSVGVIADMRSDDEIDGGKLSDNERAVLLGLVSRIDEDVRDIEEYLQGAITSNRK